MHETNLGDNPFTCINFKKDGIMVRFEELDTLSSCDAHYSSPKTLLREGD